MTAHDDARAAVNMLEEALAALPLPPEFGLESPVSTVADIAIDHLDTIRRLIGLHATATADPTTPALHLVRR